MGKRFLESREIYSMVHVKKQERQILYAFLLNEGVIAVKEENVGKHEQTKIDNLKILCVMTSLDSRGFAKKTFTWAHRYFTITQEGCAFLRAQLGITKENVNPKTHQQRPQEQMPGRDGGERRQMTRGRGGFGGDRARGGFDGSANRQEGDTREFAKPQA